MRIPSSWDGDNGARKTAETWGRHPRSRTGQASRGFGYPQNPSGRAELRCAAALRDRSARPRALPRAPVRAPRRARSNRAARGLPVGGAAGVGHAPGLVLTKRPVPPRDPRRPPAPARGAHSDPRAERPGRGAGAIGRGVRGVLGVRAGHVARSGLVPAPRRPPGRVQRADPVERSRIVGRPTAHPPRAGAAPRRLHRRLEPGTRPAARPRRGRRRGSRWHCRAPISIPS